MLSNHHPTKLPKLINPDGVVEHYRDVSCDNYDECLDEAVSMSWTSWTCAGCPLFAPGSKARVDKGCSATS